MSNPQRSAIGVEILLTVKENDVAVNLSTATGLTIYLEKPSNTVLTKTATFKTDGADGKLAYVTIANDFDLVGLYQVQAGFTLGGFVGRTSKASFLVETNTGE